MEIIIRAHNLPGRNFRNASVPIHNVHVGVQVRRDPVDLVRGDAESAEWHVDVRVETADDRFDFKGPAVTGGVDRSHRWLRRPSMRSRRESGADLGQLTRSIEFIREGLRQRGLSAAKLRVL